MSIRKLSAHLINQIAAGEVIERPASVVKELTENALDAGAKRIEVRVEEGGRQLIRVADDGRGMVPEQLPLAIEPHATSKITAVEDLSAIQTLGFRGEALASIASVSRMELISRPAEAEAGARISVQGDLAGEPVPEPCAPGTVVEVRDLFYNVPARRKFMRGAPTEYGHINDMLGRVAMAHPRVGFSLWHQGKRRWDLPAGQSPTDRCRDRLGREVEEGLIEFKSNEQGVRLWGMAAMPELAKPTAKGQFLYVNGRPVRDRSIGHALREAYRGLIPPSRQPMVVLFVDLDPGRVDVNVHPTKSEVRFADRDQVFRQVLATVRQALRSEDLIPAVSLPVQNPVSAAAEPATRPMAAPSMFGRTSAEPAPGQADLASQSDRPSAPLPVQPHEAVAGSEPAPAETVRPTTRTVLQVHNAYIVTEDEQGLIIIDQHALHERMMFEMLMDRMRRFGRLESQRLLSPAVLEAGPTQQATLEQIEPLLERLGIETTPMGPNAVAVHAFPTLLFERHVEIHPFMEDLIARAEAEGFVPSDEQALHEVVDMMSCKAAVKAGDSLSEQELSQLLSQREQIERASNCPNSRPTTIRLTLRDLEKQFKRG